MIGNGCEVCGGKHYPPKLQLGDRVRALSMAAHVLKDNPFGNKKVDHTGDVGTIVRVAFYESMQDGTYIVNFEPDPTKAWEQAPFRECMIQKESS